MYRNPEVQSLPISMFRALLLKNQTAMPQSIFGVRAHLRTVESSQPRLSITFQIWHKNENRKNNVQLKYGYLAPCCFCPHNIIKRLMHWQLLSRKTSCCVPIKMQSSTYIKTIKSVVIQTHGSDKLLQFSVSQNNDLLQFVCWKFP